MKRKRAGGGAVPDLADRSAAAKRPRVALLVAHLALAVPVAFVTITAIRPLQLKIGGTSIRALTLDRAFVDDDIPSGFDYTEASTRTDFLKRRFFGGQLTFRVGGWVYAMEVFRLPRRQPGRKPR